MRAEDVLNGLRASMGVKEKAGVDGKSKAEREYRAIVHRLASDTAEDGDARTLREVAGVLELDIDVIEADVELCREALEWKDLATKVEEATEESEAARADLLAIKKRHQGELVAAEQRLNDAATFLHRTKIASEKLQQIQEKRPVLF